MAARMANFLLWLYVINLGVAFGAGIYEARVVIPQWMNMPPRSWPNTGLMFWVYVTTLPLTLLTLINAFVAWRDRGPRRLWWLAAVALLFVERIATAVYFIPTMAGLMAADPMAQPYVRMVLGQWLFFNHGRHILIFAGWLAALKALSLSSEYRGDRADKAPLG